jgi:hypothetical protein
MQIKPNTSTNSSVTKIRWYKLVNNGFGIIIYPQIRSSEDPRKIVIWDGRNDASYAYMLPVGTIKR